MVADHQGGEHQNGVRLVVTASIFRISRFAKMKEGPVSISVRRRSRIEPPLIVSKTQRAQRRPVEAAMLHGHPLRVKATKLPRRRFLHLVAGTAAIPAVSRIAMAQAYPTRPVRITVGFAAGGATDIAARLIGQWLTERLGQSFFVENRPGANGNIATEAVVRATPDGYTLLLALSSDAINTKLYDKLKFNFIRDIAPVAGIIRVSNVLVVHPSFPAKTVPEFIAYAKANLGKVNMASGGVGSGNHLSGELFKIMAGVNMIHVPYRGEAPALADMLGGQVQVIFGSMPGTIEYIRSGSLRPLAVTSATRSEALPDIPTVGDFVPGYESVVWFGVGVPNHTPTEIIDKLNKEINAGLADPKLKARFADLGGTVLPGSPADFGRIIAEEPAKWDEVIRAANIRL
jgi:tripartite-type tricarboxylate transporter receptor subunit TctC